MMQLAQQLPVVVQPARLAGRPICQLRAGNRSRAKTRAGFAAPRLSGHTLRQHSSSPPSAMMPRPRRSCSQRHRGAAAQKRGRAVLRSQTLPMCRNMSGSRHSSWLGSGRTLLQLNPHRVADLTALLRVPRSQQHISRLRHQGSSQHRAQARACLPLCPCPARHPTGASASVRQLVLIQQPVAGRKPLNTLQAPGRSQTSWLRSPPCSTSHPQQAQCTSQRGLTPVLSSAACRCLAGASLRCSRHHRAPTASGSISSSSSQPVKTITQLISKQRVMTCGSSGMGLGRRQRDSCLISSAVGRSTAPAAARACRAQAWSSPRAMCCRCRTRSPSARRGAVSSEQCRRVVQELC
jgi:hypothetical protein